FFSSRSRHTRFSRDWSSDVCSSDLGERVSLATVYNTLHQFKRAGLLREIAIDGSKAYFDTNTSNHNHFLIESEGRLIDIPDASITIDRLPEPPEGMRISHVDVVIRLVPKTELDR